jgi:putative sigma-54 modulation protein
MALQITGTNMELTPAAQQYTQRKLDKLFRHLPNITDCRAEISEEKTKSPQQRFLVRVTVSSGAGSARLHAEERGEDLFKAVDRATAVMTRQLERHKGKLYDKGRGSSLARADLPETAEEEAAGRKVRTERLTISGMSVDEAIERMDDLGNSFFLFADADSEEIRLLFRRHDGGYGVIEPVIEWQKG